MVEQTFRTPFQPVLSIFYFLNTSLGIFYGDSCLVSFGLLHQSVLRGGNSFFDDLKLQF